jgi:hypothetical protein
MARKSPVNPLFGEAWIAYVLCQAERRSFLAVPCISQKIFSIFDHRAAFFSDDYLA